MYNPALNCTEIDTIKMYLRHISIFDDAKNIEKCSMFHVRCSMFLCLCSIDSEKEVLWNQSVRHTTSKRFKNLIMAINDKKQLSGIVFEIK